MRKRLRHLVPALFLLAFISATACADDWPEWLGPRRDGVWREDGILDQFPPGGPKVLWRVGVGPGFSGPAVAGGRVYVTDREGAQPAKGKESPGKTGLAGKERILCLNAADGKPVWEHEYDCTYRFAYPSGPRTTPVVAGGCVYTFGAMSDLFCLEAATGKLLWTKNLGKEYKAKPPAWGWSAPPLLDGDRLYCLVGGTGSAVVALHKDTGKELWRALTIEEIGYAPPTLIDAASRKQLIIWHTEAVNALDPATGAVLWSLPFPEGREPVRPGITVATPRQDGDRLFLTSPHHGPLMLKLAADKPGATILWKGKSDSIGKPDGLHSLIVTPLLYENHIYGVCAWGELRCLKADTGERLWETYAPVAGKKTFYGTAFLVRHGARFFIFNEQGDLILAKLSPKGYEEISRAHLLDPTLHTRGREVVWSAPAFAGRCVFARNDKELICVSLAR